MTVQAVNASPREAAAHDSFQNDGVKEIRSQIRAQHQVGQQREGVSLTDHLVLSTSKWLDPLLTSD